MVMCWLFMPHNARPQMKSSKAAIKKKGVWPTVSKPLCNPLLFMSIPNVRRETIHIS